VPPRHPAEPLRRLPRLLPATRLVRGRRALPLSRRSAGAASCAKTDELIEMSSRTWTRVDPRNHYCMKPGSPAPRSTLALPLSRRTAGTVIPAETAEHIEIWTRVDDPRNRILHGSPVPPHLEAHKVQHCRSLDAQLVPWVLPKRRNGSRCRLGYGLWCTLGTVYYTKARIPVG